MLPIIRYYTSDVTRVWPVNGKYNAGQKELYNFIVAYCDALIKYIKPGTTSDEDLDGAATDIETIYDWEEICETCTPQSS